MIKVISISTCTKSKEVKESIELNFPPEKKQETKILKWLKNLKQDHDKKHNRKLKVEIIHS
jgi:hypothetical protein